MRKNGGTIVGEARRNAPIPLSPGLMALGLMILASGCIVGPKYQKPAAPIPPAYKEAPPQSANDGTITWEKAKPDDGAARGKWWEIYNDRDLNALEEMVNISNQNVLAAEAQFREARDAVRVARSNLFPTISIGPSISESGSGSGQAASTIGSAASGTHTLYDLPVDISYQADIWGSIRRSVRASAESAQASFAQLEGARLTYQAALAQDYFGLHGSDGELELLQSTVKSYEQYLQLTKDRLESGVASGADVAQAQTQLESARAQLIDLGVARAQFEHAIAILVGKPPADVTVSQKAISAPPPPIPLDVPSSLLERRPDIASAERQMAAENEQIGITQAAFYPSLGLSASAGLENGSIAKLFSWPSRFWSVGSQAAEIVFDAGKRRAQMQQAQAAFDVTVANYRQTVLAAFQQVEDNLAALRILASEAAAQNAAVQAAQESLYISTYQYKAGTVSYLQVITAQTASLQAQVSAVNLLTRRMTASVLLIEALGGGWDASAIPATSRLSGNSQSQTGTP